MRFLEASVESCYDKKPMSSCGKKILGIFGGLLIVALLFVPYQETQVSYLPGPSSMLVKRITTKDSGFMFLLRYLKIRGDWTSPTTKAERHTHLNKTLLASEIGAILLAGTFDYLIFCLWLRRKRSGV
jgi:hypothetical protein